MTQFSMDTYTDTAAGSLLTESIIVRQGGKYGKRQSYHTRHCGCTASVTHHCIKGIKRGSEYACKNHICRME